MITLMFCLWCKGFKKSETDKLMDNLHKGICHGRAESIHIYTVQVLQANRQIGTTLNSPNVILYFVRKKKL